jgi:hypothetical protein
MSRDIMPAFNCVTVDAKLGGTGMFMPLWMNFLPTDYPLTVTVKQAIWNNNIVTVSPGDPIITIANILEGQVIIVTGVPIGCNWFDVFSTAQPTLTVGGAGIIGVILPDGSVNMHPIIIQYPVK